MKTTVVFICLAFLAVTGLSLAEDKKQNKPAGTVGPPQEFSPSAKPKTTTTAAPPKTTTSHPNTTTTAPPKTTTSHPNTTTTAPPKTTTSHPNTTTTAPPKTTTSHPNTTTTAPPKTTTPHPNTTTTAPPKTTTPHPNTTTTTAPPKTTVPPAPQPTPPTNVTVGNYSLNSAGTKVVCLMAKMALQIRLVSAKANGTFIVQPKLTKTEGGCKDTTANLTITFKQGFVTFMFNKSAADNAVYVDAMSFSLSYPLSKEGNGVYTANNKSMHQFNAKVGHSYSCKSDSLYMGNGLYLDVTQDQMQAFNLTKSNDFGQPEPCEADRPDYRVAIAVGVTLLVLIVIVVIAYLFGRKKRTDGYQSL